MILVHNAPSYYTKYTAGPAEDGDRFHWIAQLYGPVGSPYENGTFALDIRFSPHYPEVPPAVRFLTSIYHLNFCAMIGIPRFGRDWTSSCTVVDGLLSLVTMIS